MGHPGLIANVFYVFMFMLEWPLHPENVHFTEDSLLKFFQILDNNTYVMFYCHSNLSKEKIEAFVLLLLL